MRQCYDPDLQTEGFSLGTYQTLLGLCCITFVALVGLTYWVIKKMGDKRDWTLILMLGAL